MFGAEYEAMSLKPRGSDPFMSIIGIGSLEEYAAACCLRWFISKYCSARRFDTERHPFMTYPLHFDVPAGLKTPQATVGCEMVPKYGSMVRPLFSQSRGPCEPLQGLPRVAAKDHQVKKPAPSHVIEGCLGRSWSFIYLSIRYLITIV